MRRIVSTVEGMSREIHRANSVLPCGSDHDLIMCRKQPGIGTRLITAHWPILFRLWQGTLPAARLIKMI